MKNIWTIILLFFTTSCFGQEYLKTTSVFSKVKRDTVSQKKKKGKGNEWIQVDSFTIYGGGALLGLINNNDSTGQATTPSGSIGLNFVTEKINCSIFFSYNGRKTIEVNTLNRLGLALLNPNRAGQSLSMSVTAFRDKRVNLKGDFVITDNLWQLDSLTQVDASPFVGRLGVLIRPFDFSRLKNNKLRFAIGLFYTHRNIFGDIANKPLVINGEEIKKTKYHGLDISVNMYLNSTRMFARYSGNTRKGLTLPGFSGSQVTFGVEVTGDFITMK